jgi:hypothetical protein
MKNSFAMAAALAAGIGIGSFGVHALHAQTKPPVYMIEDNTVIDPAEFAKEFAPWRVKASRSTGDGIWGAVAGSQSTEMPRRVVSFSSNGFRLNK